MFSEETLQKLYRYGLTLTNNEANAYDLLHESLLRFLDPATARKPVDSPHLYVRRMMRNRFIDQLRRDQRFPLEALDTVNVEVADLDLNSLEDISIARQTLEIIWDQLSPLERELLYLWAVEELTAQEIARQLETPRGTILSRLHRLRKKIEPLTDKDPAQDKGRPAS